MADEDALRRDEPGAPPGFLLDPDDNRIGHVDVNITTIVIDADADPLAQGAGEVEDDDGA
jgi:hypothetical protein